MNGPDRPFAARHNAAPRSSEAAVRSGRSILISVSSAMRDEADLAGCYLNGNIQ